MERRDWMDETWGPEYTTDEQGRTFGELIDAAGIDRGCVDTALPQGWVDGVTDALGVSPVGHFVWSYEDGPAFVGGPRPVTARGRLMAAAALKRIAITEEAAR